MANNKQFKAEIVNEKQAKKYFNDTLPDIDRFAHAATANVIAYEGIKKSNAQFKKSFTLSNNYLTGKKPGVGVLKFNKAIPSHTISKICSEWGAESKRGQTSLDFLEKQEDGFNHKGMIPTKHAFPLQQKNRVIKANLRRYNIKIKGTRGFPRGIARTNQQRTLFFMRSMYLKKYAMPGSKEFIYIKPSDEFFNFKEGMYQFSSSSPTINGNFPKLTKIYGTEDKVNKKRKATNWMDKSSNAFTDNEIQKIFEKEFNRAFTNQIKRL